MSNSPYEVYQLDETCWRIEESFVRAFLIKGEDKALLIDTGYGSGNIKEVVDQLTDLPIMLVNTHTDGDHIGCNARFEKAYMHPAEFDRYTYGAGKGLPVEPLWEGEVIDLGGRRLEVILIPGHTPGSIALLDAENRILFSGDSVQAGGIIYMFGPGRNIRAYLASMKKLAAIKDRFETVYPSHGLVPIKSDILEGLVAGAERILRGEVSGTQAEGIELPVKEYDVGVAKFLYDGN